MLSLMKQADYTRPYISKAHQAKLERLVKKHKPATTVRGFLEHLIDRAVTEFSKASAGSESD